MTRTPAQLVQLVTNWLAENADADDAALTLRLRRGEWTVHHEATESGALEGRDG